MNLTDSFTLEEFITSQEAVRLGIDNTPSREVVENLRSLCVLVLEPLRSYLKAPIVISSGYRCPELNRRIKGAPGSAHMLGLAADIVCPRIQVIEVCKAVASLRLPFDQVIDEFSAWTHVAIAAKDAKPRRQQLEARHVKNVVTYAPVSFIKG